jgi:hypothetical protein
MRFHWICVVFLLAACGPNSKKGSGAGTDNGALSGGDTADPSDATQEEEIEQTEDVAEPKDSGSEAEDLPDTGEPEDSEPGKDWGKVTPKDTGEEFDAGAQCEQLGLAEEWEGTFDGKITTNLGNIDVDGSMSFEIGCFAGKLVVFGEMTGFGEGQPFVVKLQGTYNPENQSIKSKLIEGTVQLFFLLPVAFEGDLNGAYDGAQFVGDWSGENTDKTILDASGVGTWKAQPK